MARKPSRPSARLAGSIISHNRVDGLESVPGAERDGGRAGLLRLLFGIGIDRTVVRRGRGPRGRSDAGGSPKRYGGVFVDIARAIVSDPENLC